MKIACILLAAGFGKRFGGQKLLHPVDGIPMMTRACALHGSLPYAEKIAVLRSEETELCRIAQTFGFRPVDNPRASEGIGTSVAAGIGALLQQPGLDGAVLSVCDQPYLTAQTVERLLEAFRRQPERIALLQCGKQRGNPAVFPASLFPELVKLDADEGGKVVIAKYPQRVLAVALDDAKELMDMDTKGEN